MNNTPLTNTQGKPKKYYTLLNAYAQFSREFQEYGKTGKTPISTKLYQDICKDFNKKVVKEILKGDEYKMPGRLGNIRIVKAKTKFDSKKLKIDFGHLKKTGEKIYHLNKHSDGFRARWYWGKKNCSVKFKTFYCFKPSRENKRKLAEIMFMPNGHKIFQTY